ncbi:MAG TPA: type I DNA topoisomerase [Mycobacteriales bacterium]|nr:type I DNA topoisomerase [Mycobacteriales bacterium]
MAGKLVIVESPAKAKTIARYLGDGYVVESSIGHIRDLPRNAADVPASHKGEKWARLGVDVDHGFAPLYIVSPDKKQQVAKLKALLKTADELYLATDEDREGEAIAWHLQETLKPKVPVHRMVFHEITPTAIAQAVANPRQLDDALVDAQETRRILDRLYGYEVSPVLWKKVLPRLSAGRVQSVSTRLLVERERERMAFRAADYWDLEAELSVRGEVATGDPRTVTATLVAVDGARVAAGRDFGRDGRLDDQASVVVLDAVRAEALAGALAGVSARVAGLETKPYRRSPAAPFMTSTLQQEAGRKLRMSAQTAMRVAQRLYENGYITYMRTDSTTLSQTALAAARDQARRLYGDDQVPDAPRIYTRKVKNAQEAHEAIRPAGEAFRTPGEIAAEISADELRLYELIWQRTIASQMIDATGTSASVRFTAAAASGEELTLAASGKVITSPGFLRAYVEGADDPEAELEDRERRLPVMEVGDVLDTGEITPKGHQTQPPARFTEASLVKRLEELGVGRPSTYASIMQTIQDRGYAWKKGSALVPSWTAFAVIGLLEAHFGRLVDYAFTASMEDDLDGIAAGREAGRHWLERVYFGADTGHEGGLARAGGLKKLVSERLEEIDAREVNSIPVGVGEDGAPIVVRVGRYGPYVQHGEQRASIPDNLAPDELTVDKLTELLEAPSGDRELGVDPDSGLPIVVKSGRYGPYVTQVLPEGGKDRPATASLFKTMTPADVTLEDALRLLTLPRTVGEIDGEPVTAQNGRYGPYLKKGTDSRSLESEESLFTVDLDQAKAIFAQPKQRRGRGAAAAPLRELGTDAVSGRPVVVREGRFGPYVTDGETNASLRKGDAVETVTIERAAELLADRRSRGPAPKKPARKKAAPKKAAPKKAAAKKRTTTKS